LRSGTTAGWKWIQNGVAPSRTGLPTITHENNCYLLTYLPRIVFMRHLTKWWRWWWRRWCIYFYPTTKS